MKVTIEIPEANGALETFTSEHLACLWYVAQSNPAPIEDEKAGEIVEQIGREIIRRWLKDVPPKLWSHQGRHHYWHLLQKHGKWRPVNGDENNREWVPNPPANSPGAA